MTVLLVLATFLVFVVLDYFLNRSRAIHTVAVEVPKAVSAHQGGDYVDGFHVVETVSYHSGHSWVVRERKNLVRVGADEFAAAWPARWTRSSCRSPANGSGRDRRPGRSSATAKGPRWFRPRKAKSWKSIRNWCRSRRRSAAILMGADGWSTVHVPDEENTGRNLVPAGLVRKWMREAVSRLYARQPQLAGAVAADGGRPGGRPAGRHARDQMEGGHR